VAEHLRDRVLKPLSKVLKPPSPRYSHPPLQGTPTRAFFGLNVMAGMGDEF